MRPPPSGSDTFGEVESIGRRRGAAPLGAAPSISASFLHCQLALCRICAHKLSKSQKTNVTIASGYGFRNTDNLIALIMLHCSDEQPALPWEGRNEEKRKDRERDRKRRREKAAKAKAAFRAFLPSASSRRRSPRGPPRARRSPSGRGTPSSSSPFRPMRTRGPRSMPGVP
jgi:hypothetical protein